MQSTKHLNDIGAGALKGTIESDETYVGGKHRGGKRGRGSENKSIVLALIERDGRARAKHIQTVSAKELKGALVENVDANATIMTDELPSYRGLGKDFTGGHKTVKHGIGQYARGKHNEINVNSAESFFALLKRGVHGTFHHVSRQHLHRYADEFSFRWSNRHVSDGARAEAAIRQAIGKRLALGGV